MKHSKRVAALAAGLIATALALTGCGGPASSSAPAASGGASAGGEVSITLWTWGAGLEKQAAAYMKDHPNIKVEFVNAGVGTVEYEKVRNSIKAGTGAPDAFYTASMTAPSFVASDAVVDLNQFGAEDLAADHIEWAWRAGEINGGHYFYPVGWGPLMYFYRADVFEKNGIEVPKTWDEFAAASAKLHAANPKMYLSNFPSLDVNWGGALWQAGQQPFVSEGTNLTINWDGPETQKVSAYWQNLLDKDLVARVADFTPEWNQAVAQGQFASFIGGTWYTPLISGAAPDQSGKWRAALLPQWAAGENASAEAGLAGFAITKQSKHPAETEAFLRWLTSSEQGVTMLYEQGNFPTYKPVLNSDAVQNKEDEFFGGQKLAQIFLKSGEGIPMDYQFGPFYDVVQTKQIEAVGQALQKQTTLPEAMTKMQADLVTYATDQGYTVK
jgi:multiple sugar transport system substrate-binding protein